MCCDLSPREPKGGSISCLSAVVGSEQQLREMIVMPDRLGHVSVCLTGKNMHVPDRRGQTLYSFHQDSEYLAHCTETGAGDLR